MKIVIEIPEEELKQALINVIAKQYYADYSSDRRKVNTITSECVRQIIYKDYDNIHPFTINGFEINKYEFEFKGSYCGEDKNLEHWEIRLPVSKICKTVFLTPEEAEAKLKERGDQK